MKLIISILCAFFMHGAFAQNNIPTYKWRVHLPYNAVHSIAETPTHLFVGSERGFYNFDKKSGETAIFSKVNGFSDVDVAK
ncbi:MAG: hypothetical protein ACI9NN_002298, partial [Bacteroidia bacterium]